MIILMSYNSQSYSLKKKEIINFNFRFVVDIYTVLSYTLTPNFCHINLFLFSDAWYCNYLFSEIDKTFFKHTFHSIQE